MGRRHGTWRPTASRLRLSTFLIAIAVAGLLLGQVAILRRADRREARLQELIRAERARAQGYHRLARLAIEQAPESPRRAAALRGELDEETERFRAVAERLREGAAMRAVILREIGPPSSLRPEDVADPVPGPGEVVVRLDAAALNHRDVWIRKGMYAGIRLPAILGSDGSGTVVEAGEGVDSGWVGKPVVLDPGLGWGDDPRSQGPTFRVLGMPDDGTYAQAIRIPAESLHDRPAHLSAAEAAALPLAGLTAYRALLTRARLQKGETLLITGIGGGVSAIALQIAKVLGARVFVTSRSEDKLAAAARLGADGGVITGSDGWEKAIARLCGGEGPDVILDSVGGATFAKCLGIVRRGGRIVTYGATTGPAERYEITKLFWKQVDVLGSTMGSSEEFAGLIRLVEASGLKPVVDRVFPLSEASAAHESMESASQFGKIVLDPSA